MTAPDPDPDRTAWLSRQVQDLILAAIGQQAERMAYLIVDTGNRYGDEGVYQLCSALAEAIGVLGEFKRGGDGFYALQVFEHGNRVDAREVADGKTQNLISGMQFVIAHLNGDAVQKMSLFLADPPKIAANLANLAGIYGRHREAENKGDKT